MKRIGITALLFLVVLNFSLAQTIDESKYYIIYFNDTTVHYCNYLELKKPFAGTEYFVVDSKQVVPSKVMFYRNERGFFANTRKLNFSGSSYFVQRISKGKINLFEEHSIVYNQHFNPTTGMSFGGGISEKFTFYYNKGLGDIKKSTYKNLLPDISNNPQAVIHLNKFNSLRKTQNTLYSIGAALVVGSFISLVQRTNINWETEPHPNLTANVIVAGLGIGCVSAGYIISLNKPEHMRKAIDVYNK